MVTDIESESLPTHVSLCQERYRRLDERLMTLEDKLDKLNDAIDRMRLGLVKILITTGGTIVVAIIGAVATIKH